MRVVITYYNTRIAPGGSDTTPSVLSDHRLCHSTASVSAVTAFETPTPAHATVNAAIAVAPGSTSRCVSNRLSWTVTDGLRPGGSWYLRSRPAGLAGSPHASGTPVVV
jgi:hypothetical protein